MKLDRLKAIEDEMRQQAVDEKAYETDATTGYEQMTYEEAQSGKYMANFPFPYMNGFLHLGEYFFYFDAQYFPFINCRVSINIVYSYFSFRSWILTL